MDNLKPTGPMDSVKIPKELQERMMREQDDMNKMFLKVFDNEHGYKLLDWLEAHTRKNFPCYDNNNKTYSQIGKQKLIEEIRNLIIKAKGGKNNDNTSRS